MNAFCPRACVCVSAFVSGVGVFEYSLGTISMVKVKDRFAGHMFACMQDASL